MLLQPIKVFSIVHMGFNTKVFIIINRVFNIIHEEWFQDPILWVQGPCQLDARLHKVLQNTTHLCMGSKALDVRVLGSSILCIARGS